MPFLCDHKINTRLQNETALLIMGADIFVHSALKKKKIMSRLIFPHDTGHLMMSNNKSGKEIKIQTRDNLFFSNQKTDPNC